MVEKIIAGQQVKGPKKITYAKIDANLQELVKKTSIRIWLIFWEAAIIISNSNTCWCFYCDPLFSAFQFINFLPKFFKFKSKAGRDLIIAKCGSWTSFSFSLFLRQPMAGFSRFYTFPVLPTFRSNLPSIFNFCKRTSDLLMWV